MFFVLAGEGGEGAVSAAALSLPGLDANGLEVFEQAPAGVFFPVGSVFTTEYPVWANTSYSNQPGRSIQAAIDANLDKIR